MTRDPLQAASALRNAAGNHDDHTAITVPRWAAALGAVALTDAETEQDRIDDALEALALENERKLTALGREVSDLLDDIDSSLDEIKDRLAEIARLRQKIGALI